MGYEACVTLVDDNSFTVSFGQRVCERYVVIQAEPEGNRRK